MEKQDYYVVVHEFISHLEEREGDLVSVYLGGSVARDNYSPGRSDIDIYIVVEENYSELNVCPLPEKQTGPGAGHDGNGHKRCINK